MRVVDRGSGVPVVLVPGIQGRWEWMAPAVEALAARCRVITFSLADEPSAAWPSRGIGFDAYVEQVGQALDTLRLERAVICGVSYGGLIAAAFLRRYPERVAGLVLVSAIPPSWSPDARARFFMRRPRLLLPLFLLSSLRLHREIAAASAGWWQGIAASLRHGVLALTHLPAPERMARRATLDRRRRIDGLAAIHVPTLVMTGEARLDRVVPTALDRGVHAHLAARRDRDARPHRPPGPGDAARGVCRRGRAVCRSLRPAARDEETGWLTSFATFPERWDRSSA